MAGFSLFVDALFLVLVVVFRRRPCYWSVRSGFNFFFFFPSLHNLVIALALEPSDVSTCNRRKDGRGEAAKEDEFVCFALATVLLVVT